MSATTALGPEARRGRRRFGPQLVPEVARRLGRGRRAPSPDTAGRAAAVRPLSPGRLLVRWIAVAVGALALWCVAFVLVFSGVQEQRAQASLFSKLRQQLADGTAPVSAPVVPGSPVAVLEVPAIGIRGAVVVEGSTSGDLRAGPGHLPGTVLPGQAGVSVVSGRALSFGGPFRDLGALRVGDGVEVVTGTGRATYRVDGVRRPGDPVPAPLPAGGARLSLVTLAGGGLSSGFAPGHLLVVDASLVGQPAPAGAVAVSSATGRPGARDTGGLTELVLGLQLLLAVALAAVWAASRWGGLRAWVVGAPLVVAVLWGCTSAAMRLLPNVY